jgi:hypothetical protein
MSANHWTVWRQDDNGNRFPVESFPDLNAAEQLAQELESHGHKQLYWVSRSDRSITAEPAENLKH